jgi:hypothetical protein
VPKSGEANASPCLYVPPPMDTLICLNRNSISITHTHLNKGQMAELAPTGDDTAHIISSLSKKQNDIAFINDLICRFKIT